VSERRFASRIPVWCPAVAVLAALANVLYEASVLAGGAGIPERGRHAIALVSMAIVLAIAARALWNRLARPPLRLTDEAIVPGSILDLVTSREVPWGEVAAIERSTALRIELRLRSGRRRSISLLELRRSEREAARAAIEGRLGRPRD
jgi:hypothetical protein